MPSALGPVDVWWRVGATAAGRGSGRALLRHAVAVRCGREPGAPRLAPDERGRPVLLPGQGLPALLLTAARCGPLAVAALAPASSVPGGAVLGIDAEHLASPPSPDLLRHALRAAERTELARHPSPTGGFLTLWTAKEAVAKAVGWPLLRALVDVEIALRPRPAVVRLGADAAPRGWHVVPLRLPGLPHTVTLALRAPRPPHPTPERETPWT
ncbi:4'-phosphopantetheinyl transferase superfamily protein [Streptomyces griseus]|uniref:4'-phosphopantetheinyl transferase family protein n=1 Tax=Streptomyces griseus TaxID=1911 RepID=UPI0004C989A1|nr:4'-phosphopantetheinyl transferase superfamily protein [Streptomyces griseus]